MVKNGPKKKCGGVQSLFGQCPNAEYMNVKSLVFCHPGGEPDFNFQKNNIEDFGISVTHYSCQKGQPGSVVQD